MAVQPLPHRYQVDAVASPDGDVVLLGDGLRALRSQPPPAFGGPGDRWSPETLLLGAVADCFVLTFRGLARVAGLAWTSLECDASGTLERKDGVTRFTRVHLHASLSVPPGTDQAAATQLLHKADDRCLVSRSLNAVVELETVVTVLRPCCAQVQFPQHEGESVRRV